VFSNFTVVDDRAWELLTDTNQWPLWGPTVRAVECPVRYIRQGTSGRVQTPIGLWLPFRITEYDHGRYWTWRVAGIRATGHRLIRIDETSCRVTFEMPVAWLPYAIVCRIALKRIARILAAGSVPKGR
jgi:hypothetical protein